MNAALVLWLVYVVVVCMCREWGWGVVVEGKNALIREKIESNTRTEVMSDV